MLSKRRNFQFSEEDKELWKQLKDHVNPLPRPNKTLHKQPIPAIQISTQTSFPKLGPTHYSNKRTSELILGDKAGVNNTTRRKMDQGDLFIDRALDLHGMSIPQALTAFESTLNQAYINKERFLLVITGKGRSANEYAGVLRTELLKWVNLPHLSNKIVRVSQASSSHGGGGAFYILLHRVRI